jgi:hypothetical protein
MAMVGSQVNRPAALANLKSQILVPTRWSMTRVLPRLVTRIGDVRFFGERLGCVTEIQQKPQPKFGKFPPKFFPLTKS